MNLEHDNIITIEEPSAKNRFPILVQLGVLSFIMLGLFGVLLLPDPAPKQQIVTPPQVQQPITVSDSTPQKISDVEVRAVAAYVWDVRAQRALYSKNATEALPLASITKLMTSLLAYELVEDDATAAISLSAVRQDGNSGLKAGEELTTEELREIALISSSNDAAFALGANVGALLGGQDPMAQFVRGMNIRAEELGLNTLEFKNTTGLDLSEIEPGAIGSARDVSFLMEYIITKYPEIITPTQMTSAKIFNTAGDYHEVINTNELVSDIPNMIGSKTGFTDLAGGNLTIAFDAGLNRPIIVTVLGSTRNERFTDVMKLVSEVQKTLGHIE